MPFDIHSILVHFPIALVTLAVVFDWGRWIFARERLLTAAFWGGTTPILIVALIGALGSIASGLQAGSDLIGFPEEVAALVEAHETAAFAGTAILALLVFWRVALRGAFPHSAQFVYLVLLLGNLVAYGFGAYCGGMMVYVHGVGVGAPL